MMMTTPKISIVFSVFNELGLDLLKISLENLSNLKGVEVIFVDGGSSDGTTELIEKFPVKLIKTSISSRAKRLNVGITYSCSDLVLLHHPRSVIDILGIDYLIQNYEDITWGGFTHKFFESHPILNFTSWYSNEVRGRINEVIYLDHCIFFRKSLFLTEIRVPEVAIFEDTRLSLKLSKSHKCNIIPFLSKTSAVRFEKNGLLKQIILNAVMKLCFYMNFSDELMNRVYEKGLSLNTKY